MKTFLLSCFIFLFGGYLHSGSTLTAAEFALNATYKVDTVWATAYSAKVTLKNTSTAATTSWTATFTIPQGYVLSTHVTNGVFSVNGQNVTVVNLSGNGAIAAGGITTFDMIINAPRGGPTVINNLKAVANGSVAPPTNPTIPVAPFLNGIAATSNGNYTVSWNIVANATSYLLEQDTTINFTQPQTVLQGNVLSKTFANQPVGTYFYRVTAINSAGISPYSNVESITVSEVTPPPPPPVGGPIEHSAWYIDWTSWFNGPPFVIPSNNNLLNLFVGKLMFGSDGKPTMGGFGTMTLPQLDAFTAYCAAQQPPIAVKASLGGGGGSYDRCWDLLTSSNVQAFSQGLADFCHAHGLVGVDFDYEASSGADEDHLVGLLIKGFKAIDPNLQTSLCTNAGFGPNFPWQNIVKNVLDAATIAPGNCALDRMYIMSYYDPMPNEQQWILGWAGWLKTNYGFTNARVSVGIDDFDAHAYDPVVFAAWAASQGFSTAHWAFDPARPM